MQRRTEAGLMRDVGRTRSASGGDVLPAVPKPVSDDELFSLGGVRRRFSDEELLRDLMAFAEAIPASQRTAKRYRQ
jgi:hypothetical protein